MSEKNYFGEKGDGGYFTNPSTPSVSATPEAFVAPLPQEAVMQPNPIEDVLKAYTQSSHKLVIKRYAIKRA